MTSHREKASASGRAHREDREAEGCRTPREGVKADALSLIVGWLRALDGKLHRELVPIGTNRHSRELESATVRVE
jgi:hypothetical protein